MTAIPTIVELDDAKLFMRVEHTREDTLIEGLLETATGDALSYLGDAVYDEDTAPAPLKTAIMIHAAALYEDREIASRPSGATELLDRIRPWTFA